MEERDYWSRSWRNAARRRMSRRRLIQLSALGVAGAAGAAYLGCGGDDYGEDSAPGTAGQTPSAVSSPVPGGSFTLMIGAAMSTMDPVNYSLSQDKVTYNVYDSPITGDLDEDKNYVRLPNLAETWEIIDDTTFSMQWRRGVKFHDDTDFDGEAVKFHLARILNPESKSTHFASLEGFDHIENSDPFNSTFFLKRKESLINALQFWMAGIPSPTAVEKLGADYKSHPVGTGAFMFKREETGVLYEFERNPNHWRAGEPFLDGFRVKVVADKAVAAASLKAGEVDFTGQETLDFQDVVTFKNDADFHVVISGAAYLLMMWFNKTREPANNLHLRKAISYAMNREEFIEKYGGLAFITPGPLPKYSAFETPDEPDPEFSLEKAKEELKQAGYEDGIEITVGAISDPVSQADLELLSAQLAKVGIRVKADLVGAAAVVSKMNKGEYDFAFGQWPVLNIGDISYAMYHIYDSEGFYNGGTTNDPEIDRLVDEARPIGGDLNLEREIYRKIMRIVNDNVYMAYCIGIPEVKVIRKNLHGFIPLGDPGGYGLEWQYRRMWIA